LANLERLKIKTPGQLLIFFSSMQSHGFFFFHDNLLMGRYPEERMRLFKKSENEK
jgi:hypothetical protein